MVRIVDFDPANTERQALWLVVEDRDADFRSLTISVGKEVVLMAGHEYSGWHLQHIYVDGAGLNIVIYPPLHTAPGAHLVRVVSDTVRSHNLRYIIPGAKVFVSPKNRLCGQLAHADFRIEGDTWCFGPMKLQCPLSLGHSEVVGPMVSMQRSSATLTTRYNDTWRCEAIHPVVDPLAIRGVAWAWYAGLPYIVYMVQDAIYISFDGATHKLSCVNINSMALMDKWIHLCDGHRMWHLPVGYTPNVLDHTTGSLPSHNRPTELDDSVAWYGAWSPVYACWFSSQSALFMEEHDPIFGAKLAYHWGSDVISCPILSLSFVTSTVVAINDLYLLDVERSEVVHA